MHRVPGMEAMIYCKDGQCKFVNPGELLLTDHEDEVGSASQVKKLVPFILIGTTFSRTTSLPPVPFCSNPSLLAASFLSVHVKLFHLLPYCNIIQENNYY